MGHLFNFKKYLGNLTCVYYIYLSVSASLCVYVSSDRYIIFIKGVWKWKILMLEIWKVNFETPQSLSQPLILC